MNEYMTSADNSAPQELHFRIDAHAVIQLGEELITDAEQALLELVKNAYDADSLWCKIELDTHHRSTHTRKLIPAKKKYGDENSNDDAHATAADPTASESPIEKTVELFGSVKISDGGRGMSFEKIRDSWLVVSTSIKRPESGTLKSLTPMGRTPVGDKGLGRLGTMRLGELLRITTSVKGAAEKHQVSVWLSDFKEGYLLDDIPVELEVLPNAEGKQGTTVEIIGLRDLNEWKTDTRRKTVHSKLSTLINPYESQKSFPVSIIFDGVDYDPLKFTGEVLKLAAAQFSAQWRDGRLMLKSRIRTSLFRGASGERKRETFTQLIESDRGQEFYEYLTRSKKAKALGVQRDHDGFFVYAEQQLAWSDIKIPVDCVGAEDPGPLVAEVNFFLFNDVLEAASATLSIPIKQYIKSAAGISIFKEGFQVRSNQDWLGLREGQTSGGSFYGLRPSNSIGYFEISGRENPDLIETSNRENFIDKPAYRGFLSIARRFRQFADNALEVLRREYNDFERSKLQGGVLPEDAGRVGFAKLADAAERIASKEKELSLLAAKARLTAEQIELAFKDPQASIGFPNAAAATSARNIINTVAELTKRIDELSSAGISKNLTQSQALVESSLGDLRERNISLMESAAVGLSARWLAHDVRVFLDDITLATSKLKQLANIFPGKDAEVKRHLSSIQSAVRAIDRVVSFINPLLPQRRTKRESIALSDFIKGYFEIRADVFGRSGIQIEVTLDHDCKVNINRGHLLQVLDNLAQNSRYWLAHAVQKGLKHEPKIYIDINQHGFDLWDNGFGVIEMVEDTLFDLFVTDKPREEGSGIGLFIVRSLLEASQCGIRLAADKNSFNRRYKFAVDLSGAIA
jgi:signal transduction histidine kinase